MAVVLAYGTEPQAYFRLFMASCRRFSVEPVLLGWGQPWAGTLEKLRSIRDYICHLPDDEIVLSLDPFDVIFLAGLDEIESKFRDEDCPFLCGALRLHAFHAKVYEIEFNRTRLKTPSTPTGYDYLNAGTWISKVYFARKLLNEILEPGRFHSSDMDQEVLTAYYLVHPKLVNIDWNCRIFHNILFRDFITRRPDISDIRYTGRRIENPGTGTMPCVLHASGNTRMRDIGRALGYPPHFLVPENDGKNYFRKAIYHLSKVAISPLSPQRHYHISEVPLL